MSQVGKREQRERRDFKREIADRLDVLRMGPFDVLILHLPPEVIADQKRGGLFEQAQEGAKQVMEVARRGVILLPEGTGLTAESVEPFLRKLMEETEPGPIDLTQTGLVIPE